MIDRMDAHVFGNITATDDIALHLARDGILFKLVGTLSRLSEERKSLFTSSADLLSPEGLALARQEQGFLKGLETTINLILELGHDIDE